jgi:hypothetical protein
MRLLGLRSQPRIFWGHFIFHFFDDLQIPFNFFLTTPGVNSNVNFWTAVSRRPSGYFEFKHTNIMLTAVTKWPFSDGRKYQHLQLAVCQTAVNNGRQ